MARLSLSPCLKLLFLLLLMFSLVVLPFLLQMQEHRGPKSLLKKFRIRISIHWEKWLEFYAGREVRNVQWSQHDMIIKTKYFLYGEMRYWLRMHTKSLIKQEILLLLLHFVGEEQRLTELMLNSQHEWTRISESKVNALSTYTILNPLPFRTAVLPVLFPNQSTSYHCLFWIPIVYYAYFIIA